MSNTGPFFGPPGKYISSSKWCDAGPKNDADSNEKQGSWVALLEQITETEVRNDETIVISEALKEVKCSMDHFSRSLEYGQTAYSSEISRIRIFSHPSWGILKGHSTRTYIFRHPLACFFGVIRELILPLSHQTLFFLHSLIYEDHLERMMTNNVFIPY